MFLQHTLALLELPEQLFLADTAQPWHFYDIPSRLICLFFFSFSLRHGSSANESKLGPVFLGAFLLSYISSYLEISWALRRRHSRPSSDLSTPDTVNIDSVTLSSASVWNISICLLILMKKIYEKGFSPLFLFWCKQFFKGKQKSFMFPIDTIKKNPAYKSVFSNLQLLKNVCFHLSLSKQLWHI